MEDVDVIIKGRAIVRSDGVFGAGIAITLPICLSRSREDGRISSRLLPGELRLRRLCH